jgi:hypothetical protein
VTDSSSEEYNANVMVFLRQNCWQPTICGFFECFRYGASIKISTPVSAVASDTAGMQFEGNPPATESADVDMVQSMTSAMAEYLIINTIHRESSRSLSANWMQIIKSFVKWQKNWNPAVRRASDDRGLLRWFPKVKLAGKPPDEVSLVDACRVLAHPEPRSYGLFGDQPIQKVKDLRESAACAAVFVREGAMTHNHPRYGGETRWSLTSDRSDREWKSSPVEHINFVIFGAHRPFGHSRRMGNCMEHMGFVFPVLETRLYNPMKCRNVGFDWPLVFAEMPAASSNTIFQTEKKAKALVSGHLRFLGTEQFADQMGKTLASVHFPQAMPAQHPFKGKGKIGKSPAPIALALLVTRDRPLDGNPPDPHTRDNLFRPGKPLRLASHCV